MKKLLFSAAIMGLLITTSCKKDDDGGGDGCKTCELTILGSTIESKYCDNGDGTMTVTTEGQSQTTDLEGVTFAQFISSLEEFGGTCR